MNMRNVFLKLVLAAVFSLFAVSAQASSIVFGVTGDGGSPSDTMFSISTTTAAGTSFLTLGAGGYGEAIGFNPVDGFMYHASGSGDATRVWESIDLGVPSVATSGGSSCWVRLSR